MVEYTLVSSLTKKRHIQKSESYAYKTFVIFYSYCGLYTMDPDLFLTRPQKGDICKNCIRYRKADKLKVRSG